jgi:hypothetical protein
MPVDFDIRYNNVAPPALWFEEPLAAGDNLALLGMHEDGLWQFELPAVPVRLSARLHDGRTLGVRPSIDTVLVEPGTNEVQLALRRAFPVGRGKSLLREIRVDEAEALHTERHAS